SSATNRVSRNRTRRVALLIRGRRCSRVRRAASARRSWRWPRWCISRAGGHSYVVLPVVLWALELGIDVVSVVSVTGCEEFILELLPALLEPSAFVEQPDETLSCCDHLVAAGGAGRAKLFQFVGKLLDVLIELLDLVGQVCEGLSHARPRCDVAHGGRRENRGHA